MEKAIEHGKEHRKQYYGSKRFSGHCRGNTCPQCRGNATFQHRKEQQRALASQKDAE
jgi:hypothetical protein